jgi:hypothetical protein
MAHPMIRLVLLLLLVVCGSAAGCAKQKNVNVMGTVLRDGRPLPLSKTGTIQVTLKPDVAADQQYSTYPGECDREGHFEIRDVPPGTYIIGIQHFDPTPQTDKLNGAFATSAGKIKRDIDGKEPLVIDLAKGR